MQSRGTAHGPGRPGAAHPSPGGLGCPLCNREWAVGPAVGGWASGNPVLCAWPCSYRNTAPSLSRETRPWTGSPGVGGEDAAMSRNFPLQLINPMGARRPHRASSVGPQLQAQHPVGRVATSGAPRIGVVQSLGVSPAADWASVWWGGSPCGVTAGRQPPGCLSLLGPPAPGWPLPKPPTPWRSGMCPR